VPPLTLRAATPAAWLDAYLPPADGLRIVTVDELLTELEAIHLRLRDQGTPRRAAAKYLAAWYGGAAATSIGLAWAGAEAGFALDGGLRWQVGSEAWPERVELGPATAVVAPGHPWSEQAGTETVADVEERRALTVGTLADAFRPVNDALSELGGVGAGALWSEVGDGFGGSLQYQTAIPVTAERVAALEGLAGAEPAPWRAQPSIWTVDVPHGTVCVMQKAGCCLAYTEAENGQVEDEDSRLFAERFQEPPDAPRYCLNCRHRSRADCEARQVWWSARS
jgi:hypothetical protein